MIVRFWAKAECPLSEGAALKAAGPLSGADPAAWNVRYWEESGMAA